MRRRRISSRAPPTDRPITRLMFAVNQSFSINVYTNLRNLNTSQYMILRKGQVNTQNRNDININCVFKRLQPLHNHDYRHIKSIEEMKIMQVFIRMRQRDGRTWKELPPPLPPPLVVLRQLVRWQAPLAAQEVLKKRKMINVQSDHRTKWIRI